MKNNYKKEKQLWIANFYAKGMFKLIFSAEKI